MDASEQRVWYASYGSNQCPKRFRAYLFGGPVPGSHVTQEGCTRKEDFEADEAILIPFPLCFPAQSGWWKGGIAAIDVHSPRARRRLDVSTSSATSTISSSSSSSSTAVATTIEMSMPSTSGRVATQAKEGNADTDRDDREEAETYQKEDDDDELVTLGRMYRIRYDQFVEVVAQENGIDAEQVSRRLDLVALRREKIVPALNSLYGTLVYLGERDGHPIVTFTIASQYFEYLPPPSSSSLLLAPSSEQAMKEKETTDEEGKQKKENKNKGSRKKQRVKDRAKLREARRNKENWRVKSHKPSVAYLQRIAVGLRDKHGLNHEQVVDYFVKRDAQHPREELANLLAQVADS